VHRQDFKVGDVFYVTVRCVNECQYDLKMNYAQEFGLFDSKRQIFKFSGHETNIFKYWVPAKVAAMTETQKFEILIEPEVDYKHIEMRVTHDPEFRAMEDKPDAHITPKGLTVQMSTKDKFWCTECMVYLVVNMLEERRLYATATPRSLNLVGKGLVQTIDNAFLAN